MPVDRRDQVVPVVRSAFAPSFPVSSSQDGGISLSASLVEQMTNRSATDGFATQQFHRDEFDRSPVTGLIEQMFHLGQEPAFEPFGLSLAGSLHGESADGSQVGGGSVPGIRSGVSSFGRCAGEGNENLTFQPIFRGTNATLLELAAAEPGVARQDADSLHRAAQSQRDHGMPRFVIGRRDEARRWLRFDGDAHRLGNAFWMSANGVGSRRGRESFSGRPYWTSGW